MPQLENVLPKYLQIAGFIRDQIVRGDLGPGEEVASEREIASTWGVARPTAARALQSLRVQGLVVSRQGSGTYVREHHAAPRARERYDRGGSLGSMYGAAEEVEFLATDVTSGPPHVTEALQLPTDSPVVRRARLLRGSERRPIELSTAWFAPHLADQAPKLLVPQHLLGGTAKYLAEITGHTAAYARDQVAARLATDREAQLLSLVVPAAVLIYRLLVLDADDQPVQFDDAIYPPDQWNFRQEYPLSS